MGQNSSISDNISPQMAQAIRNIYADYGDRVHPAYKCKDLLKFGRNQDVETAMATIMTLPDTVDNETYVSTNIITTVISDNTGDTEDVIIEGHTISGGDFTFVVQSATLNGRNAVTLTTPLARVSRLYNNDSTDLSGQVYVCEDDTYTNGVPDTNAGVHLMTRTGQNQSEKCATTISSSDYWVITSMHSDMLTKAAAFGEVDLEVRLAGKVFRPVIDMSVSDSHRGFEEFNPYLVIPSNSDVRVRAVSDSASGRDMAADLEGFLLKAIATG